MQEGAEYTLYEGIVIQNNDPDKMGRIKVFVPGVSNTIYDNWNNIIRDKEFSGIDGDLIPILEQLKEDLPWANRASPFFGGDNLDLSHNRGKRTLERPSDLKVQFPPEDAFNSKNYTPADYSESSAGAFSIPSVGSHVYLFFKFGNTSFPVYFASAHGQSDYASIYKDNYPSDYENEENASDGYSNKHVLNSSKHTLEFIDSDGIEAINLSHFSGSNIQFVNEYISKYCVQDDYTLIENNKYETVRKNVNLNVGETINIVVGDGSTITVNGNGTINVTANTSVNITTPKTNINGDLHVTGNIDCDMDVNDKIGTLDELRIAYNGHAHPGVRTGNGLTLPTNTPVV